MHTQSFRFRLSFFVFACIAIAGCRKTVLDNPVPPPVSTSKQLIKVTINDMDSIMLNYSPEGLLQKVISTEYKSNLEPIAFHFSYDASNKLQEINTSAGTRYKYVYMDDKLRLIENYLNSNKISENVIDWADNKVTANTLFVASDGDNGSKFYKPTYNGNYHYDENGELKRFSLSRVNANHTLKLVSEKIIDQYENSHNPLSVLSDLDLVSFTVTPTKNSLKETIFNDKGVIEEITEYSYVFDAGKHLISATTVITNPCYSPTTLQYRYYYK